MPNILLATLCLNEMEWLPKLYEQHKDWPGLVRWVFVEATDWVYQVTNPDLVSPECLSVDGTSRWLKDLSRRDSRVTYIPFGLAKHKNPDQCKCEARQQYLNEAEQINPDFVFVLDADEFYTKGDQQRINRIMEEGVRYDSFCFPHAHPWRPPSIRRKPLFQYGVKRGFWAIGFVRGWRWMSGNCYRANHNHIETKSGASLCKKMLDLRDDDSAPKCVHTGFTASLTYRRAKHRYYEARGEGKRDGRDWYVESRAAFETWTVGTVLPRGAVVGRYDGPIPECFQ